MSVREWLFESITVLLSNGNYYFRTGSVYWPGAILASDLTPTQALSAARAVGFKDA